MEIRLRVRILVLCCCLVLQSHMTGQEDAPPVAVTKYGRQQGKSVAVKGTERRVHVFLGIPFAKPPVGELRFAPPQPPVPWRSVRDATKDPPICLQNKEGMVRMAEDFRAECNLPPLSEDCLYLNIFTPRDRDKDSRLPVMVFIHGGGLRTGGMTLYDGSALSAYENLVIVSIQYRLGILGFLSTGDERAPGNYGFLDQVAALRWVQENIADFGGDPQSVTIFGESAGGVSVSALVLSPLSKGLFHRAIAESGTALLPGFIVTWPESVPATTRFVANTSGCDLAELMDCLKAKTEDEILSVVVATSSMLLLGCVDGTFLPKPPEEIMANKEGHNIPLLIGVNNHEFGWVIPRLLKFPGLKGGMNKDMVQPALNSIRILGLSPEVVHVLLEEKFHIEDPLELRNQLFDLCGDLVIVIPVLKTAKYHRDSGFPVYFYEFQHRPSSFKSTKPDFIKADHGDEILSVFGAPFLNGDVIFKDADADEDAALSKTVMKYWANFARTGDPNGPDLVKWPQYGKDEEYLEIDLKQKANKSLKQNVFDFWTKTIPEKVKKKSQENKGHVEL